MTSDICESSPIVDNIDQGTAEKLARQLMAEHGLSDWRFRWTHGHQILGSCCNYKRTIRLSRVFVTNASAAEVTDTILHEIAHALTNGHGHDEAWKQKCRDLGCRPEECKNITMPTRWRAICPSCNRTFGRNRRNDTYICGMCRVPLIWESTTARAA